MQNLTNEVKLLFIYRFFTKVHAFYPIKNNRTKNSLQFEMRCTVLSYLVYFLLKTSSISRKKRYIVSTTGTYSMNYHLYLNTLPLFYQSSYIIFRNEMHCFVLSCLFLLKTSSISRKMRYIVNSTTGTYSMNYHPYWNTLPLFHQSSYILSN